MRELGWRLKAMHIRLHNEVVQEAAFHGIKLDLKYNEELQEVQFTPEQESFLHDRLKEAQARKTAEIRAQNG